MSVSILEVLENARYNICKSNTGFQIQIGKIQLNNAVELLNKDYSLDDDFDAIMGDSEDVDDIPYKPRVS